ncbi:NAD(P)H-dependent glycerol-3-phosphate dehydrogenase [Longirhabdus pacifica]|uniref:NAD(P)H-dependent glycerol-3-phosphate dehydrogenase n=1 Tax=Longirhabdus pacifica TaxID=2305227 RepID=UPI0010087494|nr:NAD(P)H-dependent glycerol-3-phosphate dehydrogenase [Longirhabdus pacifica]
MSKVAVIVAGSWGTALASVLAENEHEVIMWSRDEQQVDEMNIHHSNEKYLPGVKLSSRITATASMEEAMLHTEAVVLASPSHAMRQVVSQMKPYYKHGVPVIHVTKGFEPKTLLRMSEVIEDELQLQDNDVVVLSGPSHAEEVIQKCPTTVVVASNCKENAEKAQDLFINSHFRVYTNPDVVGVELGGALKNIIALGAGLSDGLNFGDNAKAALLTRGLAEIARLGMTMGGDSLTFAGLSGIGDLIVTCTSKHSRNWRAGYMIGQGKPLDEVLEHMGMVVEGIKTTEATYQIASNLDIEMPITTQLFQVLFQNKAPKLAVEDLMGRGRTHENEEIVKSNLSAWSL